MSFGHLFALLCLSFCLISSQAITQGGRRAPPGLVPLNPVGIYGSMEVSA